MSSANGPAAAEPQSQVFLRWLVVAGCFAATFALGETLWSFGVFFKPLEAEFGWNRATTSSAYSAFLIGYGTSCIMAGRLSDRFSPRPVLLGSAILMGIGMCLSSLSQDINQLRALMLIAGLGSGATWSVPTAVVQQWFAGRKMAGLALAIVTCGAGVGALVYAPLLNYVIQEHDWRVAYVVMGTSLALITVLAAFLVRRGPGLPRATVREKASSELSSWQGIWTRVFLGVTFLNIAGVFMFQSVSVHLVPFATDAGVSASAAAFAAGLVGALSVPGRLVAGFAADRIGWQKVVAISLFGQVAATVVLLFLSGTMTLYVFIVIYGLMHGMRMPGQVGLIGEFFGTARLGQLIGIVGAISQFIAISAPYFCGFVFDQTGHYSMAFGLIGVLLLTAAFLSVTLKKRPLDSLADARETV